MSRDEDGERSLPTKAVSAMMGERVADGFTAILEGLKKRAESGAA
jgi:hypothetical protein